MKPDAPLLPRETTIGGVRIAPNLVLSPMEGVTDITFRRLIRSVGGCGLTVTEFIQGGALANGDEKAERAALIDPDERPVAIQLFGRDPTLLAEGARVVEAMGATFVDINMGCPSKKVCAHSGGSSLLKDSDLVRRIVAAVKASVSIPVTVKMRSGFDAASRNAPEVAWICQEEGASAVTVHWRTREDRYGGVRAVDKIGETKARLSIPVFGNGDVVDVESALAMLRETGCDGLYIGRGAVRNPWLFRQIADVLEGRPPTVVDAAERRRVFFRYVDAIRGTFQSEKGALGRMKMLSNQFFRPLPEGEALRERLVRSNSIAELYDHAEGYFTWLGQQEAA